MSIVLLNQKKADLIDEERAYINGLQLRLFVNNHVPAGADGDGDYTEPTDAGYAFKTFTMSVATLNGANQGELLGDTQTWTFSHDVGDFTVYGYFWKDPFDGHVVLAERAAAPFTVTTPGQTYSVTPRKVMDTL